MVDERFEITIDVTQKDIDEGVVKACERCPIALATLRATLHLGPSLVSVDGKEIILDFPDGSKRFAGTPDEAHDFICDFDDVIPVAPFSFVAKFGPAR